MAKGRSVIGAVRKQTRNQRRKEAYAKDAAATQHGAGMRIVEKMRSVRLVGTRVHRRPCGNIACKTCVN